MVKATWSVHMTPTSGTPIVRTIKRTEIRKKSSGTAIDQEDFILPIVDDRYLANYPLAYHGPQTMHLDLWYTSATTYPATICRHERITIIIADVAKMAPPNAGNGPGESTNGSLKNKDSDATLSQIYPDFLIYPNPSTGLFELTGLPEGITYEVTDIQGKTMSNYTIQEHSGSTQQIDLQDRPNGLYFVKFYTSDGSVFVEKLIKQ